MIRHINITVAECCVKHRTLDSIRQRGRRLQAGELDGIWLIEALVLKGTTHINSNRDHTTEANL